MLRALDGTYAFAADGDGTHVTYDLRVDLSVPMPGLLKRRAAGMITQHRAAGAQTGGGSTVTA